MISCLLQLGRGFLYRKNHNKENGQVKKPKMKIKNTYERKSTGLIGKIFNAKSPSIKNTKYEILGPGIVSRILGASG